MKFEDIDKEAKDIMLENTMEFQEGMVINMQKPIVAPQGTPDPHHNYQAQLTQKFVLSTPQRSAASFALMASFRQDHQDAVSATYSTQGSHQGLIVRKIGPAEVVAQWFQQPHGMPLGLFVTSDIKGPGGAITSCTFIRSQMLTLQHLLPVHRGVHAGVKARYDMMSKGSHFGGGLRWVTPDKSVYAFEYEDTGSYKMSMVRRQLGMHDTAMCAQFEYGSSPKGDTTSTCSLGMMRQYLNHTKVRLAVNTDLQVKGVVEAPVGRVCNASYNFQYDSMKRALKHGIVLQM